MLNTHTHTVSLAVIGQRCADILAYIFSGEGGGLDEYREKKTEGSVCVGGRGRWKKREVYKPLDNEKEGKSGGNESERAKDGKRVGDNGEMKLEA